MWWNGSALVLNYSGLGMITADPTRSYFRADATTNTGTWRVGALNGLQVASSNRHLKENINDLDGEQALSIVQALRPRTFTWKPTEYDPEYTAELKRTAVQAGFVVEEIAEADLPFLMVEHRPNVSDDMSDEQKAEAIRDLSSYVPYYWKEPHLIAILTSAVKYLDERVSILESKLAILEGGS